MSALRFAIALPRFAHHAPQTLHASPHPAKTSQPAVTLVIIMPKLPCEVQDSGFVAGWTLPTVFYDICSDGRVSPSLFSPRCSISLVRIGGIFGACILQTARVNEGI